MIVAFYKATRPGLEGIYSRAVRFIEHGPYSHCEVIFSDGTSASASFIDKGVRFKQINYNPENWDFVSVPDAVHDAAKEWFAEHEGRGYDVWGNVAFVLPIVKHSAGKWFCSEAIAAAIGMPDAHKYGPNGLAKVLRERYPA